MTAIIKINDIFDDLIEEKKKLLKRVELTEKCYFLLEKYRIYLFSINSKECNCFSNIINSRNFNKLEKEYKSISQEITANNSQNNQNIHKINRKSKESHQKFVIKSLNIKNEVLAQEESDTEIDSNYDIKDDIKVENDLNVESAEPAVDYHLFLVENNENLYENCVQEVELTTNPYFLVDYGKQLTNNYNRNETNDKQKSDRKLDQNINDIKCKNNAKKRKKPKPIKRSKRNANKIVIHSNFDQLSDEEEYLNKRPSEVDSDSDSDSDYDIEKDNIIGQNSGINVDLKPKTKETCRKDWLKCEYENCDYRTKSNYRHKRHFLEVHHNKEPKVCNICENKFWRRNDFAEHRKWCTGGLPFICSWPQCKQAFETRWIWTSHMADHTGQKPFKCEWPGCEAQFLSKHLLKNHQNYVHSEERPFPCCWPGCDAAFKSSNGLATHGFVHSGIKNFVCDFIGCGKRFCNNGKLQRHLKTHTVKRFECFWPECRLYFRTESRLNEHLIKHQGMKQMKHIVCKSDYCEEIFPSKRLMLTHFMLSHKKPNKSEQIFD